jgi:hypothetical protein
MIHKKLASAEYCLYSRKKTQERAGGGISDLADPRGRRAQLRHEFHATDATNGFPSR